MEKKNDNTLLKNASFLMVAALVSKIIGLIYKSPLSATLGNESFGCFSFAQNVYLILYPSGSVQDHGGEDRIQTLQGCTEDL